MRLNPECIRNILLQTEKGPFVMPNRSKIQETFFEDLEFLKSFSSVEIFYHINQCEMMDFISTSEDLRDTVILDLNPAGHSFLADIRNDNIWNQTKSTAKNLGVASLDSLKNVAVNIVSAIITSKFNK